MDPLALVRTLGSLALVLSLLLGAAWAVRRFGIRLPGAAAAGHRRLALVERLPLDSRRTVLLLRRDGVEHLVLVAPEGACLIEARIGPGTADA